jgi:hypothetical protein
MKKGVVGYIPRLLFKLYLYLKEKFDPKPPISKEEHICYDICINLILNEDSKLTFAPVSLKRFIKLDEKDMFVVIENRNVNLINHVYSYSVYMENEELFEDILKTFDQTLEKRRQSLEDEIRNNIQHSLQNILEKIKLTPEELS